MNTKKILDEEKRKDFVGDFNKFFEDLAKSYKKDAKKIEKRREYLWRKYPEIFNDSSDEMNIDEGKTWPKKPNLGEIKERLLRNRTTEAFADYHGVQYDPNLTLVERMIKLKKRSTTQPGERFTTMPHFWENCYKVYLMNRRKPIRKHWRRLRSRDGGRNFCVSCTNWFLTITNFSIVRFLFVSFKSTSKR